MKNILITGANGFLGKRFCRILKERKYFVKALVLRQEAGRALSDFAEVSVLPEPWQTDNLSRVLAGIDTVIHLAGRAHVLNEQSEESYTLYQSANVELTRMLLEAGARSGVKKFLFMSSVMAMFAASEKILTEESICVPVSPYGRAKLEAEKIVREQAPSLGIEFIIIRPPLVYGPGVKANFRSLISIIKSGIPLPFKNVDNRRSFVYLGNLVDAVIACINHPLAVNETFMISDGEDISTAELIKRIAFAMNKKTALFSFNQNVLRAICRVMGKNEALEKLTGSLVVDSSKIRNLLGWKPPFTMEEGIRETVYRSTDSDPQITQIFAD